MAKKHREPERMMVFLLTFGIMLLNKGKCLLTTNLLNLLCTYPFHRIRVNPFNPMLIRLSTSFDPNSVNDINFSWGQKQKPMFFCVFFSLWTFFVLNKNLLLFNIGYGLLKNLFDGIYYNWKSFDYINNRNE